MEEELNINIFVVTNSIETTTNFLRLQICSQSFGTVIFRRAIPNLKATIGRSLKRQPHETWRNNNLKRDNGALSIENRKRKLYLVISH